MHNTPVAAIPKASDLTSSMFLLVALLTGIAGVLRTPTFSLFLTDGVYICSGIVGSFFTGSAVTGILVSQFLVGHSGRKGDRKNLIASCCVLGMLACALFAWSHNYFILLLVGVSLSNLGLAVDPQVSIFARGHADRAGWEVIIFSSVLRAQVSLAQAIGPPLTYALAVGLSLTVMYLSAAVVSVICGVMVWLFLPSVSKNMPPATGAVEAPRRNRYDTLLLLIICMLMWRTNSLCIISISLSITNKLYLPEKLADITMGTAIGLETPTMLTASYFTKRLGKRLLTRVVVVAGFFFYTDMLLAHSPAILPGLQLLNAIYIGILGGTGMLYFQDLMSGQVGSVIILYTDTIHVGWITVGSLARVAAEIWNYHTVFWSVLAMIVATVACLVRIKDI